METKVKIHSVKYNVVMNMILTSSSFLFPLVTTPYVSRALSTTGTGAVAFAQSVANYFSLVALLGVNTYGTRACAQVREDADELSRVVKELLILLVISTAAVSLVYFGSLLFIPKFQQERALFILFGGYVWLTSLGVAWFYQALEQYDYITFRNIAFKLLSLVLMFLFVRAKEDYVIYGATVVFASGGSNVLNIVRLSKMIDLRKKQKLDVRRHLKPMKWFAIAAISSGMYINVDIVMLGFMGTTHMVGLYQLVSKIKSVLVTCVNSVGNVMLPRLSHYQSRGDNEAGKRLISKNINFVTIVGLAVISLLVLCSRDIVLIMGGEDFLGSTLPLMVAGPAVLFSAMNIVLGNYMVSQGMEANWACVNVLGLIFATLCNVIFIPLYGVLGSAMSVSACEGVMLLMRLRVCWEFVRTVRGQIDPARALICSIISMVPSYLIGSTVLMSNPFFHLIVSGMTYMVVYALALVVTHELLVTEMLKSVMRKKSARKNDP